MGQIKKTLLEIVQDILNNLDSDPVNSIDDTEEATQVANIVSQTYYDLVTNRDIPELKKIFQLLSFGDSTRPNYLKLPSDISLMERFWYNKGSGSDVDYRELKYYEPVLFLDTISR